MGRQPDGALAFSGFDADALDFSASIAACQEHRRAGVHRINQSVRVFAVNNCSLLSEARVLRSISSLASAVSRRILVRSNQRGPVLQSGKVA
jgi:hypothetical protein